MNNRKNKFGKMEWAGAFGDLGTLIPYIVGYVTIAGIDALGILFTFGIFLIVSGFIYKTPFPVQPMKAIGAVVITSGVAITNGMIWFSGLFTGAFWLILGLSGVLKNIVKIVNKPVMKGIILSLGISFIMQGTGKIQSNLVVGFVGLLIAIILFSSKKIPLMFILLLYGVIAAMILNPALLQELVGIRPHFRLPMFNLALGQISRQDILRGILILALPQIPLTLGNSVMAVTAENNRLFPDRPITEKKVSLTQGAMNIISPLFGGVPICHGAGGMAAQIRFGAKTGGAPIIIGVILLILGLFFSESILSILSFMPESVLGIILLFAGLELAISTRDVGRERKDFFIYIITAGFSLWNVGVGFLVGLFMQEVMKRNWLKP
ncbi:MAG: SulP family inorganic anion transporter [Lachnospiraceae bacterium]|nr:SulP family inorganic anion transporter [Lachnospiraceae bacterium]